MRIVSLLPSATEWVGALGLQDRLVGRSHECDWPPGLEDLPVLTRPKTDPRAEAALIDADVRRLVEQGLSAYALDADRLAELAPDVIVTQSQCELCAVSLKEVEAALRDWMGPRRASPRLVSLEPMTLEDVFRDIRRLSAALGCGERGARLISDMKEGLASLSGLVARQPRKSVFFMEWTDPLMGAGNWMPEIIEAGGGRIVLGEKGVHSPTVGWADVRREDPEVIVAGPCGFDVGRARREMRPLTERPEWRGLRAVREGGVYLVNGNHFFNRPGPRLLESARMIAEMLHPGQVAPNPDAARWERLPT